MLKTRFLVSAALAVATPLYSQRDSAALRLSQPLPSSTSAALQSPAGQLPPAPGSGKDSAAEEETPAFSVTAGFIYLQNDLTDTPGGTGSYLLGWYGIPEYHINEHLSVIADFTNLYNYHAHQTENVHGFAGGPQYGVEFHKVELFGYVEGGAARDSRAGAVSWSPQAAGGVGLNFKLTHAVEFQVIPGEYNALLLPNGNWQSNYDARAGFVFTSFRAKHHS